MALFMKTQNEVKKEFLKALFEKSVESSSDEFVIRVSDDMSLSQL